MAIKRSKSKNKSMKKGRRKNKRRVSKSRKSYRRKFRGGGALPFNAQQRPWGKKLNPYPPGPTRNACNSGTFYSLLQQPSLPDPSSSNKPLGGGRKKTKRRRRRHKKRSRRKRHKTNRRKKHRGRKHRSRKKKGAGLSQMFANYIPGGSDIRDVYWKMGEKGKNLINTWNGRAPVANTSAGVQPIGKEDKVIRPNIVSISANLKDGSDKASQFTPYK